MATIIKLLNRDFDKAKELATELLNQEENDSSSDESTSEETGNESENNESSSTETENEDDKSNSGSNEGNEDKSEKDKDKSSDKKDEEKKDKKKPKMQEIKHPKYDQVKLALENKLNVYLYGEAGTGKNHMCEQLANELGLDFYFCNAVQNSYDLIGYADASGVYHETSFFKAFKNGGLFMFDEIDASIPEVFVTFNAALANGYFDFPIIGRVRANENFRVVAAGNTLGKGADAQYTGRLQLDGATLDRFVIVEIDYDKKVEMKLAEGDQELVNFVENFRQATKACGINHVVSYRCIQQMKALSKTAIKPKEILRMVLIKELTSDDVRLIYGKMKTDDNSSWFKLLEKF